MVPHDAVLDSSSLAYSERVALSDDGKTNVHVFSRALRDTVISVANLGSAQRVLDVCQGLGGPVVAAMSGGFFARADRKPLGDLWIGGERQPHVPFQAPWHKVRGSLHVAGDRINIDQRRRLPVRPDGDLLQAGPVLVMGGKLVVDAATDLEGFSAGSDQFDSDITAGRYPRAAIGHDGAYVYSVVVDGRSDSDVGMTLARAGQLHAGTPRGGGGAEPGRRRLGHAGRQGPRRRVPRAEQPDGQLQAAHPRREPGGVLGDHLPAG
jgi:hypothetical protein